MSKSVNECLLIGNVGKDPEIKQVANTEVAEFTLATSQGGYKKQDGTEVPERTQWHRIVAWRGLAAISKYIHKGDKVIVKGTIEYREYEKDGVKRYVTDIVATDIVLTTKSDGGRPPLTQADIPLVNQPQQNYASPQAYAPQQGNAPQYWPQPQPNYNPQPPAQNRNYGAQEGGLPF